MTQLSDPTDGSNDCGRCYRVMARHANWIGNRNGVLPAVNRNDAMVGKAIGLDIHNWDYRSFGIL